MKYENPKCPICNTMLEEYEMWETWREDAVTIGGSWFGICPKCKKEYCWDVTYKALYFSKLQPAKETSYYDY